MHQTIEVIVYPDGRIEACEEIHVDAPHRALLTILDELPPTPPALDTNERSRVLAILSVAGLVEEVSASSVLSGLLDEAAYEALWAEIPPGTPLSQFIDEDRGEHGGCPRLAAQVNVLFSGVSVDDLVVHSLHTHPPYASWLWSDMSA